MFPEKEIVGLWLNSNGYLVVNDINAGKNKVVDALALKVEQGKLIEAIHVEVSVSVASGSEDLKEFKAKFSDTLVKKAIASIVKRFSGTKDYKKLLVVNSQSVETYADFSVKSFEDVLGDVIANIDRQSYNNPTVRTLQLIKYLILSNPSYMKTALTKLRDGKDLSTINMEKFFENMLDMPVAKRVFSREKNLEKLEKCLAGSAVFKPQNIATMLIKNMTTRSFNQFLKELFSHEKARKFTKKKSAKQRSLSVFLD